MAKATPCTLCGKLSLSAIWCNDCTKGFKCDPAIPCSIAREQYVQAWYLKQKVG